MTDQPTDQPLDDVHAAMARVMEAITAVAKVGSDSVSYRFRSIDDVMNALHGPLADNGLWLSPHVLDGYQLNPIQGTNNRTQYQALFRLEVVVHHRSGTYTVLGPGLAQSHDYGDKAVYQAQQNAMKYLLLEAFSIPTDEPDMDSRPADPVPAEPRELTEAEQAFRRELTEAEQAFRWIAEEGAIFKAWTEDQRRAAYKTALEMLAYDSLTNMEQARNILEHMRGQYESGEAEQPELGS